MTSPPFSTRSARTAPRPTAPARWISTGASSAPGISTSRNFPTTAAPRTAQRRMAFRLGAGRSRRARTSGSCRRAANCAAATPPPMSTSYGTTLRVYDPDRRLANPVDRSGGEDMMTQMAPMLEMMKAKMGKRRFAMMMQTMGPMMSRMMEGGGGGGLRSWRHDGRRRIIPAARRADEHGPATDAHGQCRRRPSRPAAPAAVVSVIPAAMRSIEPGN